MTTTLLLAAAVILLCLALSRATNRMGVPSLMVFIVLGMLFGVDGIFRIEFDNYALAEQVCSVFLVLIMFYGGFGTAWRTAKEKIRQSVLLSTAGVVITAALTGLFCHFVLQLPLLEALLIGAVVSSTDAASVFSILRSKRLNLGDGTAPMLEVESGSNDPCAYMLTVIVLQLMNGQANGGSLVWMLLAQVLFGTLVGAVVALGARWLLQRVRFSTAGYDTILVFAAALISYAGAAALGGNGYLSTYITGMILGNSSFPGKRTQVHFFDGVTGLMQMLLFFLLGLLATPSRMPQVILPALAVALFLSLVARPAAVMAVLAPFKASIRQMTLVSWAGLRGAASIVFAIMAVVGQSALQTDLFHMVFFIVLFSIAVQGSLLPKVARKLDMIDDKADVMKTFSDYSEETPVQFLKLNLQADHPWVEKPLRNIRMIPEVRIALVIRAGEQMIPRGNTTLLPGDTIILSGPSVDESTMAVLTEVHIEAGHEWSEKRLCDIEMPPHQLVVMIRRGKKVLIPDGATRIHAGDVLVMHQG